MEKLGKAVDEEEIEDCMVAHNMKSDGKICFEEFKLMF